MRRAKRLEAMRQAKEAKQKKLLFVLIPVFLLLAVWQGPKTLKAVQGGSDAAPAPPVTSTAPTGLLPAPTGTSTTPTQGSTELADTDAPPQAGEGQLTAFGQFLGRNPFDAGLNGVDSASGSTGGTTGSTGGTGGAGGGAGEPTSAVISVNGKTENIAKGSAFPTTDPTFTLVALTSGGAVIGLVQGLFEDGSSTMDIAVGEEVVLIAAPDTTQYRVKLVSVS
jgi:hypothetical protein